MEERNIRTAKTLKLRNGKIKYPITDVLDISPDAEVEFFESVSRSRGTGYINEYYRVVGTDAAIVISRNLYSPEGFYDSTDILPDYFREKRVYGQRCRAIARRINCPMEVALACGPEHVEDFVARVRDVKKSGRKVTGAEAHELLECGIDRRKAAIKEVLDDERIEFIGYMGQLNTMRVAQYITDELPTEESETETESESEDELSRYQTRSIGTSLATLLAGIQL